ncbi:MAG: glycoside hydrolase family 2 protein, partial [Erysipelotrichaceae bacterium]|nr:glycoside hydrolase family 2 protein [Erysipelotrichaceae bacterium]
MKTINDWYFSEKWNEDFKTGKTLGEKVRLPHTTKETGYHYINEKDFQMICGYRTTIKADKPLDHKKAFLVFEAAGHIATVYVDGDELMTHLGGYTSFKVDVTDYLKDGKEHTVAVKLDSTENPKVPPFGYVIDYLTYGGLYREVRLEIEDEVYAEDIFVYTPMLDQVNVEITLNQPKEIKKTIRIKDPEGKFIKEETISGNKTEILISDARAWDVDDPVLYTCEVQLEGSKDVKTVEFGFRTAEFKDDGFYLNGQKLFIRGLNRHQSYPYVGYAATESLQIEDARILKEELGCNAVRTSHYPQSHYFISACDRLGLLVFTEIPGWQHIGDEAWKDVAVKTTEEMVMQYRNHPSIILWGVRINESQDDDEFYTRTNDVAHRLDPTRQTSGVRYLENSSLLEDVYSYNDFSHNGSTPGCKPKKKVTKEDKPLIITEANGHMFPTKMFDNSARRQEHALRHARVLNDAMADGQHAGCFQWCMFDYPTHKDFGSGDRVCYHGVMDGFRNPKLAAALYASQQKKTPVLEISSSMDIGDYPGGLIGKVYVFSNADEVKLYKNDQFVTSLARADFPALDNPPFVVDDTIGDLLKTNEGFTGNKEKILHECLRSAAVHGYSNMPLKDVVKMGYAMARYKLKYSDGVELFGKYVGNWGGSATVWRFDGIVDDEVVISRTLAQSCKLHLDVQSSSTKLTEKGTYDMAMIRVR